MVFMFREKVAQSLSKRAKSTMLQFRILLAREMALLA
jgi:hypothetical protein